MRNVRLLVIIFLAAVLAPLAATGAAYVATRSQGVFFASRSSNPLPSPSPGLYNLNGVLQACAAANSDAGSQTCYPEASPVPTPSPFTSADAGTALGSGAAINVDTCATGDTGSTCYRLKDVVRALKLTGKLSP